VILPIQRADGEAIVQPTAPSRDGMPDVAAPNAANSKAIQPEHAEGAGRKSDFRPRCAKSSWMLSIGASRSGRYCVTWPDFQSGLGAHQDRRGVVRAARSRSDGNPSGRPTAWH
jgi:hypothetical protein